MKEDVVRIREYAASGTFGVRELPDSEHARFLERLAERFAFDGIVTSRLSYTKGVHVLDRTAWSWPHAFLTDKQDVLLFFPYTENSPMFIVPKGADVVPLIRKASLCGLPHFEFYVAGSDLDYIFYFDHEQALYGNGTAETWLEFITSEIFERIGLPSDVLSITTIQATSFGQNLVLDCIYGTENPKQVQLQFVGCRNIEWEPPRTMSADEPSKVNIIYLGSDQGASYRQARRACIKSRGITLRLDYSDLIATVEPELD